MAGAAPARHVAVSATALEPGLYVTTDKDSYLPGEPVRISGMFVGPGFFTFPSTCVYYFVITDGDGNVVYDLRAHCYYSQILTQLSVTGVRYWNYTWHQVYDNGTPVGYPKLLQVEAVMPALFPYQPHASASFKIIEIEPSLTVTTDKHYYLPGEPVGITVTLNAGPMGLTLTFPSSLQCYYVISTVDGIPIYDLQYHVIVLLWVTTLSLAPWEVLAWNFTWEQVYDSGGAVEFPRFLRADAILPCWGTPMIASSPWFEINPKPGSCQLDLLPGWNLVSMPLLNDSFRPSALGLKNGSVVAEWDDHLQGYQQAYLVGYSDEIYDFAMMPGHAYFIWTAEAQTIDLHGCCPDAFESLSIALDVPAGGGWACVAFNTLGAEVLASEVDSLVSGSNVGLVCKWDPGAGKFLSYLPGVSPSMLDFVIGSGEGCWLWVDGPGTLSYSP